MTQVVQNSASSKLRRTPRQTKYVPRLSGLLAFTLLPASRMTKLKTARIRSSMLGSC